MHNIFLGIAEHTMKYGRFESFSAKSYTFAGRVDSVIPPPKIGQILGNLVSAVHHLQLKNGSIGAYFLVVYSLWNTARK